MSDYLIGLKIPDKTLSAKAICIFRKYTDASIYDIKASVMSQTYVISVDSSDNKELRKLKRCYKELLAAKIKAELWETIGDFERPISLDLLSNSMQTNSEIAAEIDLECADEFSSSEK